MTSLWPTSHGLHCLNCHDLQVPHASPHACWIELSAPIQPQLGLLGSGQTSGMAAIAFEEGTYEASIHMHVLPQGLEIAFAARNGRAYRLHCVALKVEIAIIIHSARPATNIHALYLGGASCTHGCIRGQEFVTCRVRAKPAQWSKRKLSYTAVPLQPLRFCFCFCADHHSNTARARRAIQRA